MKRMIFVALIAGFAGPATAGTVLKEGPHGSSITNRVVENGILTTTETWTGKKGGTYERTTVCENNRCSTGWTLIDRKGRMSSGERDTVSGGGQSTTTATTRGFRGETRTRTINRTRSVTR